MGQGFSVQQAAEVVALGSKPEGNFANLLLPSIPTSNQRSSKQIGKNGGAQYYNGASGGGNDKVVVPKDHELHIRRNDTGFKVARNTGGGGLSDSPIISQNKISAEQRLNGNGLTSGQSNARSESFRIRPTKNVQVQQQQLINGVVISSGQSQSDEYQSSIFNAYTSPPLKIRQSANHDKKLKSLGSQQQPPAENNQIQVENFMHLNNQKQGVQTSSLHQVPTGQVSQQNSTTKLAPAATQSPNPSREMSATLLHLNVANSSVQHLERLASPEKQKINLPRRRKSGASVDDNDFSGGGSRSKNCAPTRASTFTQAMNMQHVQSIQVGSGTQQQQHQPFTQVQVGKTLKRKLIKFNKQPKQALNQQAAANYGIQNHAVVEEDGTSRFPNLVDYQNCIEPKTERIYQSKSRRVDFCRRRTHKDKMIMIIHFEGVIGEVKKKDLKEDSVQLVLRHGAVEGLKELLKNFQVVLYSSLCESTLLLIVEHFIREHNIVFDAVYRRPQALIRSDEFCNYNQIYSDFDLCDVHAEPDTKVEQFVILVLPILLSHEEIKEVQDDALFVQYEPCTGYLQQQPQCIRGIPTESGPFTPLLFLVPHHTLQKFHYSVSLLNISTVLNSLLIAAWSDREDLRRELQRYQVKENELCRKIMLISDKDKFYTDNVSPPRSPIKPHQGIRRTGTLGAMTFTTINPKNQFKQLLALAKDKEMHMGTCSWIRAFFNVKKYKLFQLRFTATCVPFANQTIRCRQDEQLRLRLQLHKYRGYRQQMFSRQSVSNGAAPQATGAQKQNQINQSSSAYQGSGTLTKQITQKTLASAHEISAGLSSSIQSLSSNLNLNMRGDPNNRPLAIKDEIVAELLMQNEQARGNIAQYKQGYYSTTMQQQLAYCGHSAEALDQLIQMIENKLAELNTQVPSPEQLTTVPVYRCLVLLGHEFQNFPSEVSKVFKMRAQGDRNIAKWMLQGRKVHHYVGAQKTKGGASLTTHNQIYSIQGAPQMYNLHREESLQVYNNQHAPQETHLMPGKYSIF